MVAHAQADPAPAAKPAAVNTTAPVKQMVAHAQADPAPAAKPAAAKKDPNSITKECNPGEILAADGFCYFEAEAL